MASARARGAGGSGSIDPAADLTVATAGVPTGTTRDDPIIRLERQADRHFHPVHERGSQHCANLAAENLVSVDDALARFVGAQLGHGDFGTRKYRTTSDGGNGSVGPSNERGNGSVGPLKPNCSVTEAKKIQQLRWIRAELLVHLLVRFPSKALRVPRLTR